MMTTRPRLVSRPRGQAVTELALSSLVLVSLITFGIYFGEVIFGSLKVTEAGQSALWDLTHYKAHSMTGILYSTNSEVSAAAGTVGPATLLAYQDFDGRSSVTKGSSFVHVMTKASGMRVTCARGGATSFNPNPLGILSYSDNGGANCNAEAVFATGDWMPQNFAEKSSGNYFKKQNFARATLTACASGVHRGGTCAGRFAIMLDDWGLTGPRGGEWNPCPGLPFGFGVPCPNNLSYWWTAFKAYLTSYLLNAAFKPLMFTMPASLMAQWVAFANPMGGFAGLIAFPLSGNESTFYMSFTGSITAFEQPLWVREGWPLWETTPFAVSLAIPYSIAFIQRTSNGGCYLGKKCN